MFFYLETLEDKGGHIDSWLIHPLYVWLDLILFEPITFIRVIMIGFLASMWSYGICGHWILPSYMPQTLSYYSVYWFHQFIHFFNLKLTTILKLADFDFNFGVRYSLDHVDLLWTLHTPFLYIEDCCYVCQDTTCKGYSWDIPPKKSSLTTHVLPLTTHCSYDSTPHHFGSRINIIQGGGEESIQPFQWTRYSYQLQKL